MATDVNLQTIESEVAEIYISTFGRAPDQAGLAYWVGEVVKGNLSIAQVSESFFDQRETQTLYADTSNEDFVKSVYLNTLGRDADNDGLQYWLDGFTSGEFTKDVFIKTIINGAKDVTGNADDALLLQNKVNTGLLYAKEIGVADSDLAKQIMNDVTSDASTAENAMGLVDFYSAWVDEYSTALGVDSTITKDDLWKNINDKSYWTALEADNDLTFAAAPTLNFWDQADDFWADGATPDTGFDFLKDETKWQDEAKFQKFDGGEFAAIDPATMFAQYADKSATMYADLMSKDMDSFALDLMFGGMDADIKDSVVNSMFSSLDDENFAGILENIGTDGMGFLDGIKTFDFSSKLTGLNDQFFADAIGGADAEGLAFFDGLDGFKSKINSIDNQYLTGLDKYFEGGEFSIPNADFPNDDFVEVGLDPADGTQAAPIEIA